MEAYHANVTYHLSDKQWASPNDVDLTYSFYLADVGLLIEFVDLIDSSDLVDSVGQWVQ